MKQVSLYHFILQRHLQQLLLAILSIFVLSTLFFLFSMQYRAQQQARETAQFIGGYLDTYFDPYIQQSREYDQNQDIRNLFSNLNSSNGLSDAALEGMTAGLRLSSNIVLCIGDEVIWPADATLPDGAIPETLSAPALCYAGNLYFVTPYFNFFHTEQLGTICYFIPFSDLQAYIERFVPRDLSFSIADAAGTVFFSMGDIPDDGKPAHFQEDGFSCTVYPDLSGEMQNVALMLLCLLLVCVFVLLFSLLHSRRVAAQLSDPISALTRQLQHNQSGELDMQYYIPSNIAEINQLTKTYADLIDRLKDLITQNQKQNLLRMEAELSLLQTQIDPHFLFNTLEVISSQAILESADVTAELIQRLGTLFRYNLRAPEIVPLERELQYAGDYCFLQNMQWDEAVHLDIGIDGSVHPEKIQMPKLTLQPILENCFQHGFSPHAPNGYRIAIAVRKERNSLCISVQDNGCGLKAAQIDALYEAFSQDRDNFRHFIDRTNHIGLRNINARLCIHFHIQQAIWLRTSPQGGTEIAICIPYSSPLEELSSSC